MSNDRIESRKGKGEHDSHEQYSEMGDAGVIRKPGVVSQEVLGVCSLKLQEEISRKGSMTFFSQLTVEESGTFFYSEIREWRHPQPATGSNFRREFCSTKDTTSA